MISKTERLLYGSLSVSFFRDIFSDDKQGKKCYDVKDGIIKDG